VRADFRAARKQSNPLGARCPMLKESATNRAGGCRRIGLIGPALGFERGLVAISRDGGEERRLTFHHSCSQGAWSKGSDGIATT
jgi:hypothetical protein